MYKIIIVDDEPLMLEGFSKVINWQEHGFELIGAFRSPLGIMEFCDQNCPDIILLDINMPDMDGITLLKSIKHKFPKIHVIMLTAHNEFDYVRDSLRYHADEYLWKPEMEFEDILACMNRVIEGEKEEEEKEEEKYGTVEFIDYDKNESRFSREYFENLLEIFKNALEMEDINKMKEESMELWRMIEQDQPKKADIMGGFMHLIYLYQERLRKHNAPEDSMIDEKQVLDIFRKKCCVQELTEKLKIILDEKNQFIEKKKEEEDNRLKGMISTFIMKNIQTTDLNLMYLSKEFNISYSYFSRIFSEIMGKNFSKYLVEARMERACEYLKNSDFRIDTILEMVGYNDKSYFIKSFKNYTGLTPSKYRDKYKTGRTGKK